VTAQSRLTPALVAHPSLQRGEERECAEKLEEAVGLAEALDLAVLDARVEPVREARPATLFGQGKVEEIAERAREHSAEIVVVDAALTPVQQRNLERAWNVKVVDRTGLILEIFARRARTKEGVLQVELARLSYERSRLVRTWTHLERQRGGRGFLAGPGETQLEADRRMLDARITRLRRDLDDVRRTRGLHREGRRRAPFPVIALVGYTNAGKSTLFNKLTDADVLAKDMLFATLDTTMRGMELPSGLKAMVSDTVGFISDLPHDLIEAFRATLEEVSEADLLVHVRDISHPETDRQRADVEAVLEQIGAGETVDQHVIEAWNKTDALDPEMRMIVEARAAQARREGEPQAVLVSALTGEGLDDLARAIDAAATEGATTYRTFLDASDGRARAWLHEHGEVLEETADETGRLTVIARLSALAAARFERTFAHLAGADDQTAG
jgi:GTP-binding protein HflX